MLELLVVTELGVIGDEDAQIEDEGEERTYMTSCKCTS